MASLNPSQPQRFSNTAPLAMRTCRAADRELRQHERDVVTHMNRPSRDVRAQRDMQAAMNGRAVLLKIAHMLGGSMLRLAADAEQACRHPPR